MTKKFLFVFFFFLVVNLCYSQKEYTIEGKIVDQNDKTIANANVIVREITTQDIINYTISQSNGSFETNFKTTNEKITISISCLGYKTINTTISLNNSLVKLETIRLIDDATELKEVIVIAEKNDIIKKGDTTIYNVKKFLNGTEDNLKDLISNLPGMKINNNGKIEVNGNVISELLIDGENLYKNQHQFATENLNSKIVKSIEYYKNYTPYDKVKKDTLTNETALNIIIKDEYKNKFKGYLLAENNLKERFKINSNLYNFSKKNKFSIIHSTNNLGELPISTLDYFTLIDNEETKSESSVQLKSYESIPKFLKSGENVAQKKNTFVNISNVYTPTKKTKINFFSIFNQADQTELSEKFTEYNNSNLIINENTSISEKSFFNLSSLKVVYKPNLKTIYKFNSFLSIDNLSRENNLSSLINEDSSVLNQNNKIKNLKLENKFDYSKKYENSDISASLLIKKEQSNNNSSILSDRPFLNLNFSDNFIFTQQLDIVKNDVELESKYSFKLFKINNSFSARYSNIFRDLSNLSLTDLSYTNVYKSNEDILTQEYSSAIDFTKKIKISFAINNNFNFQKVNSMFTNKINYLGYNFNIDYFFTQNSILRLNNSFSRKLASYENLIENEFIQDYRTIVRNSNLQPNSLFPVNKISLNYLNTNPDNNNFFIANLDHTWKRKYEGINQIVEENFIVLENIISSRNDYTTFFIYTENKFKNKPYSITYNFDYNYGFQRFYINNLESFYKSSYFSNAISLKSKFKKSLIHFNSGVSFSYNSFNNNDIKNNNRTYQAFTTLNGLFLKNFYWKINYSYNNFIVEDLNNTINILSANLRYSKPTSNWEYNINAHNIFNLTNPVFVSNQTNVGYQSRLSNLNLSGYVNFGLKYKF